MKAYNYKFTTAVSVPMKLTPQTKGRQQASPETITNYRDPGPDTNSPMGSPESFIPAHSYKNISSARCLWSHHCGRFVVCVDLMHGTCTRSQRSRLHNPCREPVHETGLIHIHKCTRSHNKDNNTHKNIVGYKASLLTSFEEISL